MSEVFSPNARYYAGIALVAAFGLLLIGTAAVGYYVTPKYTRVGYAPPQPIAFSHELHVGKLGMDCRHCHTHVGESPHANIPSAQVCMNCHSDTLGNIKAQSPQLAPLREAWQSGRPIDWARVHQVPDYAYFNHAIHVARGVSCVSCHGQVNEMPVVVHDQPLSMSWCLECHRNPDPHLRPADQVTNLDWLAEDPIKHQEFLEFMRNEVGIQPPDNCAACHR